MPTGTITWYSRERGHGFIDPDGGGSEVFARSSDLTVLPSLTPSDSELFTPGVRVVYDLEQSADTPQARRIQLI